MTVQSRFEIGRDGGAALSILRFFWRQLIISPGSEILHPSSCQRRTVELATPKMLAIALIFHVKLLFGLAILHSVGPRTPTLSCSLLEAFLKASWLIAVRGRPNQPARYTV